jgi:hypothetical protein
VQYTATEILLVESAGGFDSWIGTFGTLADSTAGGDPDNDGMENVLEYVLNGNPAVSGPSTILPAVDVSGANFVFTFSRREESALDSTQAFEYSTDLVSWTPVMITTPTAAEVTLGTPAGGLQTVTVTIPKGTNTSLFGRLRTQK